MKSSDYAIMFAEQVPGAVKDMLAVVVEYVAAMGAHFNTNISRRIQAQPL